jgi:hypothetical protein
MKTTLEIPDALFRRVKMKAAERGQSLKAFVGDALREKLASGRSADPGPDPDWMRGFGKLRRLRKETKAIEDRIREAFDIVEPEDRS